MVNAMSPADGFRLRAGAKALRGVKQASEAEINKTAEEFEGMFLHEMLSCMFEEQETNQLFGGGAGEEAYKSMVVDEYAKLMAKTGGIGIASHVKAEMLRLQEVGNKEAA